jgi:chromosome segregation ATPase
MRGGLLDGRRRAERRLFDANERLGRARAELEVIEAQLAELSDQADEAQVRAVVSETPLAEHEWSDARRHAEHLARRRDAVRRQMTELEHTIDELIGKLVS